jgi:phosphoribosyl-AMP cyclohydrolase / phosphoribosyl-ATP pyrophosphohydrolase
MNLPDLKFSDQGLIPVITQDADTGEVLMFAHASKEALEKTLSTKQAHYFSRSRQELWHKGATSGNTQDVVEVRFDCDEDVVLYRIRPNGPACHTGEQSCFYRTIGEPSQLSMGDVMGLLERVVGERLQQLPEGSYVTKLHERGIGYVAQKVVEEAGESIVAALQHKDEEFLGEAADLLFHLTVLLKERGLSLMQVSKVLQERHRERTEKEPSS